MGEVDDEQKYLSSQYPIWALRDLLEIIHGTSESILQDSFSFVPSFLEKLTFCQVYDFIKSNKQLIYHKKDFTHVTSCDMCHKDIRYCDIGIFS